MQPASDQSSSLLESHIEVKRLSHELEVFHGADLNLPWAEVCGIAMDADAYLEICPSLEGNSTKPKGDAIQPPLCFYISTALSQAIVHT